MALGEKVQRNDHKNGRSSRRCCIQNTHSHDTFVHVQVIRTMPAQMFHSPREHAWLKGQHGSGLRIVVSPERFRLSSVMSHMLPHLSLNTSTRSLSPTSPIFRPCSPSCPLALDEETLRDSRLKGGSTEPASPTDYEPNMVQSDDFEPRRIEFDRKIGTDPYQIPERILGR